MSVGPSTALWLWGGGSSSADQNQPVTSCSARLVYSHLYTPRQKSSPLVSAPCVAIGLGITFPQVGVSHLFGHCWQGSAHESCVQNPLGLLGILGLKAGVLRFSSGFVYKVEVP